MQSNCGFLIPKLHEDFFEDVFREYFQDFFEEIFPRLVEEKSWKNLQDSEINDATFRAIFRATLQSREWLTGWAVSLLCERRLADEYTCKHVNMTPPTTLVIGWVLKNIFVHYHKVSHARLKTWCLQQGISEISCREKFPEKNPQKFPRVVLATVNLLQDFVRSGPENGLKIFSKKSSKKSSCSLDLKHSSYLTV